MAQGALSITARFLVTLFSALLAGFLGLVFFSVIVPLPSSFAVYTAAIVFGGFVFIILQAVQSQGVGEVERGEILLPSWQAKFRSWWKTKNDPYKFFWGGLYIPFSSGNMGLVAVGAPSSGKTVSIRLFLQSVLPLVGAVPDHRAIIYDAKSEMMPILAGMGIDTHPKNGHVKILNPYDTRSYYWEMWRDITDIDISAEIALLFIPVNSQAREPVWDDRARSILKGVLDSFILTKKEWSLRDLCAATLTKERIEAVLAEHPSTKSLIASKLGSGKPAESVVFSLQAAMEKYHNIASLWDSMPEERGISFYDWLNNPNGSILLLGRARDGTPLGDINKLMIARIGQLIAEQNDLSSRRTWIIIDELRQCGRLDLSEIATTGRGRGASLVLGYQDNNGLKDAYGTDGAKELLGMCQHKAIFRLSSESTANDAAGEIGQQDVKDDNGQERTRYAVLPSELTSIVHIPETNVRNGLTGYYKSTAIGAYTLKINGKKLFYEMLSPIDRNVEGFKKVSVNDFPFEDWTDSDLSRLGYLVAGAAYTTGEPPPFDFSGFDSPGAGFKETFADLFGGKSTEKENPSATMDDDDPLSGIGRRKK